MSREPKQRIPCIIRISNLGVHFGKNKFALYTGKYGTIINMLPLWFVHTIEETENPSVRVGGGGCRLVVFCSWMIPCFYYDPLC